MKKLIHKIRECFRCVLRSKAAKIVMEFAVTIIVTLLFRESLTVLKLGQTATEIAVADGVLGNVLERL